ncbi:MAG: hypothetical protein EP332_06460 [Bacteroidetes bacterium]|nr:MAG: hypothetical protein EP332_06460 [Bacteroidota bacterium]
MNKPLHLPKTPDVETGHFYAYGYTEKLSYLDPEKVDISDKHVARGLANNCRWGGQGQRFLSVAQHSILVVLLCPDDLRKEALLHDGHEAYLPDVPTPLKPILGEPWKKIEERWAREFIIHYGLDRDKLGRIKAYDMEAAEIEYEALFLGKPDRFNEVFIRYNLTAGFWSSITAYHQFKRFMTFL